jgi:hypothetical protein
MSRVERTITVGAPHDKGEVVLGTQKFVDGKLVFVGSKAEADNIANYYVNYFGAKFKDKGQPNENVVQEDRTDTSGKSNLPSGSSAGQKSSEDAAKK